MHDDSFSAIQVQYPSTKNTGQNKHHADGGKEKAWIGHPMIDCINWKEGAYGSPKEEREKTKDGRLKSFSTEKEAVFGG